MVVQLKPRWKAGVAVVALSALLVWPLFHYRLVERHRLNPWKFFGFAMYCTPTLPVRVETFLTRDGVDHPFPTANWPSDGRRALYAFRENRQILGTLRPPNRVASWLFRTRPDVNELVVVVGHASIDRDTGLIVEETFPYRYYRPGFEPR